MDEFTESLVIQWYEDIEGRLLEFLSFIPFTSQNHGVFSPRLSGLLTETCEVLDSLFREISPPTVKIGTTLKKRKDLKIGDYGVLYASKLDLPNTQSVMYKSPPIYRVPFRDWSAPSSAGLYSPPVWWTVYNKQKHSRLQDIQKATLEITVEALCGLHQAIVKFPELAEAILRHEWVRTGGMNPAVVIDVLKNPTKGRGDAFIVETKLFASSIGDPSFPPDISDLFPGAYIGGSPSLAAFLGRW